MTKDVSGHTAGLNLAIHDDAFRLIPELSVHAFAAHGIEPSMATTLGEKFSTEMNERLGELNMEQFATHPRIAPWRDTFRRMGLQPSEFRASVEQLARRAARGTLAQTGVWTADLYNRLSIAEMVPIGGYDINLLPARSIEVRQIDLQIDSFEPLGGTPERFSTQPGVLIYACEANVLCWALNHRDSTRTALRDQTTHALFISEAVDGVGQQDSLRALTALREALTFAGARCSGLVRADAWCREIAL